jgi:predicted RNA-binding protein (virulence factor B family)
MLLMFANKVKYNALKSFSIKQLLYFNSKSRFSSSISFSHLNKESNSATPSLKISVNDSIFKKNQEIDVKVLKFNIYGCKVDINNGNANGFIMQQEISIFKNFNGNDIKIGDNIIGYVERIRQDGNIDVTLRPLLLSRVEINKQIIIDELENSPYNRILG